MNQGQIEQVGTPQEIYSPPGHSLCSQVRGAVQPDRRHLVCRYIHPCRLYSLLGGEPGGSGVPRERPLSCQAGAPASEAGWPGTASVRLFYEIEYQGVEVRMMLHNQADNEILEVRYRGDETYRVGDEVTLTL